MSQTREFGKIDDFFYGKEDHGILTCFIRIDFNGSIQGFGGIILDDKTGPDFVAAVCEAFDVRDSELLKGRECYALRCFKRNNASIEGLECARTGRRFIIQEWRQKHWPETRSVFDEERQRIQTRIDSANRQLRQAKIDLETLEADYTQWTSKSTSPADSPIILTG